MTQRVFRKQNILLEVAFCTKYIELLISALGTFYRLIRRIFKINQTKLLSSNSLCAGMMNDNSTYMVKVTKTMVSYHNIDGEKVSVERPG